MKRLRLFPHSNLSIWLDFLFSRFCPYSTPARILRHDRNNGPDNRSEYPAERAVFRTSQLFCRSCTAIHVSRERMPTRSLIGDLFLHRIESRTGILILAADNLVRMILHAENQPCARHAFQIGFVAQCREYFPKSRSSKLRLALLNSTTSVSADRVSNESSMFVSSSTVIYF